MSKEEQIHGLFGIELISIIKEENPELFTEEFNEDIYKLCEKAYKAENKILDWIFEKGELDFLTREDIDNFLKNRFNNSLKAVGLNPIFKVDLDSIEKTEWFNDEIIGTKHGDFFVKRSVNYNKKSKPITSNDLF